MADRSPPNDLFDKLLKLLNLFFTKQIKHVYYSAKESIGEHKRDIIVYEVEHVCVDLQQTRNQFEDALIEFKKIVTVQDIPLERRYQQLNRQYHFCRAKSEQISSRIKAIEDVSEALFVEWENELNEYSNRNLRTASKQQLRTARQNYSRLMKAMHMAESKIQPVLATFKDHVLFLKHNLNAYAIGALNREYHAISTDISHLIEAMEYTIAEASLFVSHLVGRSVGFQRKALPKPTRTP